MLRRLVSATVVVPDMANWDSQILGPGSIVDVDDDLSPSPLGCLEVGVRWVDVVGREWRGWISQVAMVEPVRSLRTACLLNVREDLDEMPFDRLRSLTRNRQIREPKDGWTLLRWLVIFGHTHYDALVAAVRELGGIVRGTEPADELSRRVIRLALNEDVSMSTETEAAPETTKVKRASKTPAKSTKTAKAAEAEPAKAKKSRSEKSAPEPVAKKSRAAKDEGTTSAAQNVGATLVKLLKRANADENSQSIAAKMAEGKTPTAKQLTGLRDGINAAATVAREKEKTELAVELSNANRTVRRLARASAE